MTLSWVWNAVNCGVWNWIPLAHYKIQILQLLVRWDHMEWHEFLFWPILIWEWRLIIRVRSWLCFLDVVFFRSFKGVFCKVVSLGSSASSMMQQVSSKESDAVGFFSFPASDPSFIPACFSMNSRVVQRHRFNFPPFPELACASCLMENYTSWLKIAENKMEIFYCQFVLSKLFVIVVFRSPEHPSLSIICHIFLSKNVFAAVSIASIFTYYELKIFSQLNI